MGQADTDTDKTENGEERTNWSACPPLFRRVAGHVLSIVSAFPSTRPNEACTSPNFLPISSISLFLHLAIALFTFSTFSPCSFVSQKPGFSLGFTCCNNIMVSGVPSQSAVETDVAVLTSVSRSCPGKKNQGKVPKKIHKAEREKLKREHLNNLFLDLANELELKEPNNGKASTLSEASRLLKDLCGQIECLRREHASLLSESRYVDIEKNELQEETCALASQIEKLQSELQSRAVHSKPDLSIPPYAEFSQQAHFSGECLGFPVMEPTMQQTHAAFIVPVRSDLPSYPAVDATQAPTMPTPHVSKPHARYPTPADSWPAGLLKLSQTTEPSKENHWLQEHC